MSNYKTLEYLQKVWEFMVYHNNMSPFPVYDTEYVESVREKIEQMKEQETDYDSLPVASCKYCRALSIQVDEVGNDVCLRCGSVNEIKHYDNIFEYLKDNDSNAVY